MAGKRKAASPPPASLHSAKQAKKSRNTIVPIDECFHLPGVMVHIDEQGTVYDATLNQTNIRDNNNKFYRIQIVERQTGGASHYWCVTRWGRVGNFGQYKIFGPEDLGSMILEFKSKFEAKTGLRWENRNNESKKNKYTYIEREYDDLHACSEDEMEASQPDTDEPSSKLSTPVQSLVKLIFNKTSFDVALQSIGYDSWKLPLGKLARTSIMTAYGYLKELEQLLNDANNADPNEDLSDALETLSNSYYSTIPHISQGWSRLPLIDSLEKVRRESDMLDTLEKMEASNNVLEEAKKKNKEEHARKLALLDQHLEMLRLDEVAPVRSDSTEFQLLSKYLVNSSGATHYIKYNIQDIFRIRRAGEWERFEKTNGNRSASCRRLLWHGSATNNFGGILSQGLRIAPPEAPVSGYMFGKGIYLADASTKSSNYCRLNPGDHGLLLLCEAELGNPTLELTDADYDAREKSREKGLIATTGMGMSVPESWVDAEAIHPSLKGIYMPNPEKQLKHAASSTYLLYNEYIVYDEDQVRLRYLIRFKIV